MFFSLALASSIPVLGLERASPRKVGPWPQIFFESLASASKVVSSTPPLLTTCNQCWAPQICSLFCNRKFHKFRTANLHSLCKPSLGAPSYVTKILQAKNWQKAVASLRMVTPGAEFCGVTLHNV